MKVFDFKCPNCGEPLFFEEGQDVCVCKCCGVQCHLEKVVDTLQKENAAGIQELTDRAYDLIRQGKFAQASDIAREGLKTYPYSGRLHLTLLLSELTLRKPSLLASFGKDYSSSANFQNCIRYMDEQDKRDLISLATQNGCAHIPQAPAAAPDPIPEPAPQPSHGPKVTIAPAAPAPEPEPIPEEEPEPEPAPEEEPLRVEPEADQKPEKKGLIAKVGRARFIILCLVFGLGLVSFLFFLIMSINVGGAWNFILVIAGFIYLGIAASSYFFLRHLDRVVCPKCNYKPRKHTRHFIETKTVGASASATTYDYYDDYWTCPQCGECHHELTKVRHSDSVYPLTREID